MCWLVCSLVVVSMLLGCSAAHERCQGRHKNCADQGEVQQSHQKQDIVGRVDMKTRTNNRHNTDDTTRGKRKVARAFMVVS